MRMVAQRSLGPNFLPLAVLTLTAIGIILFVFQAKAGIAAPVTYQNISHRKHGTHKKRRHSRIVRKSRSQTSNMNSKQQNPPSATEAPKAGSYSGDVRDLPKEKGPVRQQPKPREANIKPKIYKRPKAKKETNSNSNSNDQ